MKKPKKEVLKWHLEDAIGSAVTAWEAYGASKKRDPFDPDLPTLRGKLSKAIADVFIKAKKI